MPKHTSPFIGDMRSPSIYLPPTRPGRASLASTAEPSDASALVDDGYWYTPVEMFDGAYDEYTELDTPWLDGAGRPITSGEPSSADVFDNESMDRFIDSRMMPDPSSVWSFLDPSLKVAPAFKQEVGAKPQVSSDNALRTIDTNIYESKQTQDEDLTSNGPTGAVGRSLIGFQRTFKSEPEFPMRPMTAPMTPVTTPAMTPAMISSSVTRTTMSAPLMPTVAYSRTSGTYAPLVAVGDVSASVWRTLKLPDIGSYQTPLCNVNKVDTRQQVNISATFHPGQNQGRAMTREDLHQAVVYEVSRAIGTANNTEELSPLDSGVIYGNIVAKRCGIARQLAPVVTQIPHPKLREFSERWSSSRPRTDAFFRLADDSARAVSVAEVATAIQIIVSRPPRRVNHYCAPQLAIPRSSLAHHSRHQGVLEGSGVGMAGGSQMTSADMRVMRAPPPAGAPMSEREPGLDPAIEINKVPDDEIYRPRWVKGKGSAKCGWCEHCVHGGFFKIKNSGYLYHKNHEHGIFANNHVFEDPLVIRRKLERDSKWEGLCGICYRWIDLDHKERSKWGTWFRHYNNCTKEYDAIKKAVLLTGAAVEFTEIEYTPYENTRNQHI